MTSKTVPALEEIALRALASGPEITLTLDEVRAIDSTARVIERLRDELAEMTARAIAMFHYLPDEIRIGELRSIKEQYRARRSAVEKEARCRRCAGSRTVRSDSLSIVVPCPECHGRPAPETTGGENVKVTNEMVDRFLSWRFPKNFVPDGGIIFTPPSHNIWPIGTNLLSAEQAREMLKHVLAVETKACQHDWTWADGNGEQTCTRCGTTNVLDLRVDYVPTGETQAAPDVHCDCRDHRECTPKRCFWVDPPPIQWADWGRANDRDCPFAAHVRLNNGKKATIFCDRGAGHAGNHSHRSTREQL